MFPEKPVWIWKGDPEYALLELILLVLFFYLSFRISAYFTHRFELVWMHSKRLDRLAFRAGCNREERDLLQSFYSQLDRRHRVLLAHNHAKEYLRQHLLHYIATLDSKDFPGFLSLVSKFLGTANDPRPIFSLREFAIVQAGTKTYFAQVVDPGFGEVRLKLGWNGSRPPTPGNVRVTVFRNPKGLQTIRGEARWDGPASLYFLPESL
ncbi:hypothetical protein ND861_00720 [Leptospira sp. 2 VSF19]|uniref:Uncharacterized protein n=1 Tax=Leptospira soteropolitanensis TaxID=2950025 RepID=A0AAW5VEV7_9LEPT|nr:hypothetical protein [Leptospira soteropolitanensis]MCW7491165.1 hypothetical protein [Leptospira soteropolitanensis]MCW7498749.1 hypothetical protein [Leptospira soteropolitanensis]MCW7521658.1 hypothetical protein [Leptospira soteropolitanensis]MCW7524853.1 hypothetical protein [Leptospira soteropolitanensis]MCW7528720.1 hypothetical protein [Leptospira soteropolitanensis]